MIAKLIRWSIGNRFLVLLATLIVAAWGVYAVMRTPLAANRAAPPAATGFGSATAYTTRETPADNNASAQGGVFPW